MGRNVFENCTSLTTAVIGKGMTKMGWYPFRYCENMVTITSLNRTPPAFDKEKGHPFGNLSKEVELRVPAGSRAAYRSSYWNHFREIIEFPVGDLNLDGIVDNTDLNAIVDYSMGRQPEGFYKDFADLNGDEEVNAADVVILINNLGSSMYDMDEW